MHTCPVRCSQATTHCSQMATPVLRFSLTDTNGSSKILRPLSFLCTYLPMAPPCTCTCKHTQQEKMTNIKLLRCHVPYVQHMLYTEEKKVSFISQNMFLFDIGLTHTVCLKSTSANICFHFLVLVLCLPTDNIHKSDHACFWIWLKISLPPNIIQSVSAQFH